LIGFGSGRSVVIPRVDLVPRTVRKVCQLDGACRKCPEVLIETAQLGPG
jgi:hypothetical protein